MASNAKKLLGSVFAVLVLASSAHAQSKQVIQVEVNKGQMVRLDRNASSVVVADPEIADIQVVSPRMVYVHAKKIGETSLYAIDSRDATILDTTVEVTHNISKLQRAVKDLVPNADVNFRTTGSGLVMEGYVDSPMEAENVQRLANSFIKGGGASGAASAGDAATQALAGGAGSSGDQIINLINTAGSDQVMLKVKVAEVSRNELKNFGVNLATALTNSVIGFQVLTGRTFLNGTGAVTRTGQDNSLYLNLTKGNSRIQGVLDALEEHGLISVLAEPNVTTTSGKTANFLAGGEFPIPIVDSDGKVSVQYKKYGISLDFTPTVMSKDKISLAVAPEVSSISQVDSLTINNTTQFAIPSIQTRKANTTVELGSGQTFAIAGLLKNDRTNTVDAFPGLGELPILGALFRSQSFQNDQSELVILVTPYIVRPISERKAVASTLDGYVPPSELEWLLLGSTYREQEDPPAEGEPVAELQPAMPADTPRLQGGGGFMVESEEE